MRLFFIFIFLALASFLSAQETFELVTKKLEKALIEKDTIALKQLLHHDLSYGHSNGWVETKTEIIENLISGKMEYNSIISDVPKYKMTGDVLMMRTTSKIGFVVNGKPGELDLFVMQVWKKDGNEWKLLVRQSTRLN